MMNNVKALETRYVFTRYTRKKNLLHHERLG
jgi:hypothetical protein